MLYNINIFKTTTMNSRAAVVSCFGNPPLTFKARPNPKTLHSLNSTLINKDIIEVTWLLDGFLRNISNGRNSLENLPNHLRGLWKHPLWESSVSV